MGARAYVTLTDLLKLRYKAQGFSYLPRQPVHSLLSGRHASRLRGRGLNFEEIRAYLPGDDTRNIDWKVTARVGKPHTRVYTEERDRPALMLVDQRLNMFFGSQLSTKSATAAEAAAVSAWRVLGVGDRPGALVFNDTDIETVRPHRSETRVLELLNIVLKQNRALGVDAGIEPNPGQLNNVLSVANAEVTHDYLVCLISDLDGADDEAARLITRLAEHNDVLVLFIYDPLEAELPETGKFVISDGDLQLQVDAGDVELRQHFKEDFQSRLDTARSLLQKRQVPVLPISTTQPVIEQVRDLLGQSPQGRVA
ncbi:MAG: DUF58 domain-containing protein [Gammaproteobacteria bacterium]|jgi:uncharacterized protein (DUF58 family)